jgi:hypothetical protein
MEVMYKDKGGKNAPSLTAMKRKVLRPPVLNVYEFDETYDVSLIYDRLRARQNSWGVFRKIDLTGVRAINIKGIFKGVAELRLNSPSGPFLGSIKAGEKKAACKPYVSTR